MVHYLLPVSMRYSPHSIGQLQMDNSASTSHRLSLQRCQVNCVKELSLCCLHSCRPCVAVCLCVCLGGLPFVTVKILQLQRVEVAPR